MRCHAFGRVALHLPYRSALRSLLILILAGTLSAAAQNAGDRVSLRELAREAVGNSPEIVAAQKRYEAARQRPTEESSLPDPMISLGYNSVGNPLPGAGMGSQPQANAGVMISQELPFPGKLKLKGDMAAVEAQAGFQEYQAAQLAVVSRLKQAYYRLQYAYAATDVLLHNRDLLSALLRVTEDRYAAGKAAQQDVFKAQVQTAILEMRLMKLEQERKSREAEITSILNRAAGTPLGRPDDAAPKELAATLEELFAGARRDSPMLARDRKTIERSELAVNMARKESYPDFTLNAGYYNMGAMGSMYELRADVKVPVYFWRKQSAGVNERVSGLSAARRDYEAADQTLRFRIQEDYIAAQASLKLMALYKRTVTPQANLAVESSLASYETGAVDFLSVLANLTSALDYEMNYYDEALSYALALSRLEEMTGRSLAD
jgi:outer membrane protein TolC